MPDAHALLTHPTHFPNDPNACARSSPLRKSASGASEASGASGQSAALDVLAARVAGLFQSLRDPEAFHLEKHAIASELRRLAAKARQHGY